jgi:hypothetical protein
MRAGRAFRLRLWLVRATRDLDALLAELDEDGVNLFWG